MIPDADADRYAQLAAQLAGRVRTDDPETVKAWVMSEAPEPVDWWALLFATAVAVPDDKTWNELTDWVNHDPPCLQAARLRLLGEALDPKPPATLPPRGPGGRWAAA